jgi:hypothetical protein
MAYNPPIQVKESTFGKDAYKDLCVFIEEKIEHLDRRLSTFRTETLPEYFRIYKGKPKNEEVDWPWEGASNLVIQLCGTFCDELLSRQMGGIYMYEPLWTAMLSGDTPDKQGEDFKEIYQTFLSDMAYDPDELDLYRVEQGFFQSANKYGTGVVHFPWEYQKEVEMLYVGGGDDDSGGMPRGKESEIVVKDGPHPEMIPLNRWGFDPSVPNLGNMKFFYHIDALDYWQMINLPGKSPYYVKSEIESIVEGGPDAVQEDEMEMVFNEAKKLDSFDGSTKGGARWYIHRISCAFEHNKKTFRLNVNYHKRTKKILFITYNNYPKNMNPYEDVKLAYDEECYLGTGFPEMLHVYQKELSNNWNWRTNNRNYAMLGLLRVSPESKLSSILDVFPGVAIPARKDELEFIKAGADVGYSNEPDMFTMSCAKERAGIDPASGGTGGGIVNPKRGIYSAAGTSMVMGQQNNRNALRTSDMRSAHVKIGTKCGSLYANFGIGTRLKRYGDNASKLEKALAAVKDGTLGLRLRPTSASMNKELERQNDVMLSDRIERFYEQQAKVIEAMMNPQCPAPLKQYFAQTLIGGRVLMQGLLRNFGKSNINAYLPQIESLMALATQQPQSGGAGGQQQQGNLQVGGLNSVPRLPQGSMGGGALPAGTQTM